MKKNELLQLKLKEIKELYPDHIYKVGTKKEDYVNQILAKPSEGLGDTIEKITEATGIKKAVELITGDKDCGCEERKKILNKLFPYNKPNCMTEQQLSQWKTAAEEIKTTNTITPKNQDIIIILLKEVMNLSISNDNCKSCGGEVWKKYIDMLNKVAAEHK